MQSNLIQRKDSQETSLRKEMNQNHSDRITQLLKEKFLGELSIDCLITLFNSEKFRSKNEFLKTSQFKGQKHFNDLKKL